MNKNFPRYTILARPYYPTTPAPMSKNASSPSEAASICSMSKAERPTLEISFHEFLTRFANFGSACCQHATASCLQ